MELTVYDQEYWDCKEQFQETFKKLAEEFYQLQLGRFSRRTAQDYFLIADAWIEYLYGYTDCMDYKDITIAQTNSRFFAAVRYQQLYGFDSTQVKNKLRVFIEFLRECGYQNPNVDKAMSKK